MYLLAEMNVRDAKKLAAYAQRVAPLVAAHGGEILAVSAGGADVIEGEGPPPLLAFHRWPSRECFDRFWNSPEYAPLRALRHQACDTRITVFES